MNADNENQPINLGIVGCAFTGRQAALSTAQLAGRITTTAVADLNVSLREAVAEEFSVPRQYGDYRDLLDDPQVDAVYLGVPPDIRLPMVLDGLAAGKHILVQKPHATRAPQILEMDAAAQRADKTIQFCYYLRHDPSNRAVRTAVAAGKIGKPYHGRYFSKNAGPAGALTAGNRWLQVYGLKGGVLSQHMSHDLNLLWWWMGCPQPEWAFATKHHVHPIHYNGPEGPSEDYFSSLIGFEDHKTIQIDCSNASHADTLRTCELHGTTGAIAGTPRCGLVRRDDDSEPDEAIFRRGPDGYSREEINADPDIAHSKAPAEASPFYHEIEHFAMAIAGQVEPEVSAAEAYTFMKMLDALYDSAQTEEKVTIEP
jgi:predicted dehydrogenase